MHYVIFCFKIKSLVIIELQKDWNDSCKLYFETIMEADNSVKLQVTPVPYAIKHATYGKKLHLNFGFFDSFLFCP